MHWYGHPLDVNIYPIFLFFVVKLLYFSIGNNSNAGKGIESRSCISSLGGFVIVLLPFLYAIPFILLNDFPLIISKIVNSPSPITTISISRNSSSVSFGKDDAWIPPTITFIFGGHSFAISFASSINTVLAVIPIYSRSFSASIASLICI